MLSSPALPKNPHDHIRQALLISPFYKEIEVVFFLIFVFERERGRKRSQVSEEQRKRERRGAHLK